MTAPSPLSAPFAWNLVADGYASEVVPFFTRFAEDALGLAGLAPGARVLDVAAGPGTLSFAAARRGLRATAIDFAPHMVEQLRKRAARERGDAPPSDPVCGVEALVADGMNLPFADASFDGAFSMFGLMFFPDRAKGFGELHRALRPSAPAVVASWVPMDRIPRLAALFEAIRGILPGLPYSDGRGPLTSPEECRQEMGAAGFRDVQVTEVAHALDSPSLEAMWESMRKSNAPLALLEHKVGAAEWARIGAGVLAQVAEKFGTGPQRLEMIANLTVGRR